MLFQVMPLCMPACCIWACVHFICMRVFVCDCVWMIALYICMCACICILSYVYASKQMYKRQECYCVYLSTVVHISMHTCACLLTCQCVCLGVKACVVVTQRLWACIFLFLSVWVHGRMCVVVHVYICVLLSVWLWCIHTVYSHISVCSCVKVCVWEREVVQVCIFTNMFLYPLICVRMCVSAWVNA